jgi:hypothetical protein
MTQIKPITKQSHAGKSWTRYSSYKFAAKSSIAPLVGAEIAKAISTFPMAFINLQDRFQLVAVLSFSSGTNLFVAQNGKWLRGYVPSVFRSYPFMLAKAEGKENLILCVDEDSGLLNEDKNAGNPFFDDQGQLAKPVKDILDFLSQIEKNKTHTNQAVAALAEAGVITEWSLKVTHGDKEKPVTGLYRIDETKLNSLDDAQFNKLRKAGSLPIAYAQLLSMGNIQVFEKLAKMQKPAAAAQTPDVGPFLGDDDVISFQ